MTRTDLLAETRRRRRRRGRLQRGLTLIEILVVVTIIGIISGIVGVTLINQHVETQIKAAKIQMKGFDDALGLYRIKFHDYPSTVEGLNALLHPKEGLPLLEELPEDPWGNEYIYMYPSQYSRRSFDILSKGPDGVSGTEDDITSRGKGENQMARAE